MKKDKQPRKINLAIIVVSLVFLLTLVQLVISHNLATQGKQLRQLEFEIQRLEEENSISAEEVNRSGSLSRIAQEAKKLGLVRASQILHLTPQIPVALGNSDLLPGR